eukprot:m.204094 g.204094  ORF g.204094 m.204094 type:complete len:951 (+) comp17084_c0_seq2:138-2990(+)
MDASFLSSMRASSMSSRSSRCSSISSESSVDSVDTNASNTDIGGLLAGDTPANSVLGGQSALTGSLHVTVDGASLAASATPDGASAQQTAILPDNFAFKSGSYACNVQVPDKQALHLRLQLEVDEDRVDGLACDSWLRTYTVTGSCQHTIMALQLQNGAMDRRFVLRLQARTATTYVGTASWWCHQTPTTAVVNYEASLPALGAMPLVPHHLDAGIRPTLLSAPELASALRNHGLLPHALAVETENVTMADLLCLTQPQIQHRLQLLLSQSVELQQLLGSLLFSVSRIGLATQIAQQQRQRRQQQLLQAPPSQATAPSTTATTTNSAPSDTPPSPPGGQNHPPTVRNSLSASIGSPLRKYNLPTWDPLFTASIGLNEFLQLPLTQLSQFLDVAGTQGETTLTTAVCLRHWGHCTNTAATGLDRVARAPWADFASTPHLIVSIVRQRMQAQAANRRNNVTGTSPGHSQPGSGTNSGTGSDDESSPSPPLPTPRIKDLLLLSSADLQGLNLTAALSYLLDYRRQYVLFLRKRRAAVLGTDVAALLVRLSARVQLAEAYFLLVNCQHLISQPARCHQDCLRVLAHPSAKRHPHVGLFTRLLNAHLPTTPTQPSPVTDARPHLSAPPLQDVLAVHTRSDAPHTRVDVSDDSSKPKPRLFTKGVKRASALLAFVTLVIWALGIVQIANADSNQTYVAGQHSSIITFLPYAVVVMILVCFVVVAISNFAKLQLAAPPLAVLFDSVILFLLAGGLVMGGYSARVVASNLYEDGLDMDLVHVALFSACTVLLMIMAVLHHWAIRAHHQQCREQLSSRRHRSRGHLYNVVSTRDRDSLSSDDGHGSEDNADAGPAPPRWMGGWLNTWLLLLTVGSQMEFSYFIIMQVQPDHYWDFLGCFYVIDLFLILSFSRGMLIWDDWGCDAVPLDDQEQAAALMPELRHPNPERRLRAATHLRDSA